MQSFSIAGGGVRGPGGLCLAYGESGVADTHCCRSGWVSVVCLLPVCPSVHLPVRFAVFSFPVFRCVITAYAFFESASPRRFFEGVTN